MSAGQIWRRPNGLRWVEIQNEAMEPSGWRIMVPLFDLDQAPDAPPLVVTVDDVRARVHLIASAPSDDLGDPVTELDPDDVALLRAAAQLLFTA